MRRIVIPEDAKDLEIRFPGGVLQLTNLRKPFWKTLKITKRDLLQYYADVAPVLLPHLAGRAMVMKRYPNGAEGDFFYMKRAPEHRPDWIRTCLIPHDAGDVDFPIVQDLPSLLWIINLGCIDLNPWYARCDDWTAPTFSTSISIRARERISRACARSRSACGSFWTISEIPSWPKTTGSRGIHIYIPIVRGPLQKEVWTFAKAVALRMEARHPDDRRPPSTGK